MNNEQLSLPLEDPRFRFFSKEELEEEFRIATQGMAFETEDEQTLRQLFFSYFTAGALWAVEKIAPGGIVPASPADLAE